MLDYISIVMMLVSEGGENSQMALIRYFFDLHKIIVVYGLDPKILLYGYFGAIKYPYSSILRSEEHTSELQSRPHISYAVFCLKKKKQKNTITQTRQ